MGGNVQEADKAKPLCQLLLFGFGHGPAQPCQSGLSEVSTSSHVRVNEQAFVQYAEPS
jgi:hypothetical protein